MIRRDFVPGAYRPFNKQYVYFDRRLNDMVYQLPSFFPTRDVDNFGLYILGLGAQKPFSVQVVSAIPDLNYWGSEGGQFFPRFTYIERTEGEFDISDNSNGLAFIRVDNITDKSHADYRGTYGAEVSKDDIFYYVYGILHSPEYRAEYAADLKKMLPRIPKVASIDEFHAFVVAGRELAELHIGYETVAPYSLQITGEPGPGLDSASLYDYYRVEKMKFAGKDRSTVIYNSRISVAGIPDDAHEYQLGSRSVIEWIIERYQRRTDKASGIVNNPNDWSHEVNDPRYILDLLARVVTISVETVRIVRSLPTLDLA